MERSTFEGNFCDIAQCRDPSCRNDGTCTQKQVWERLKQFEDAVQTPERFYKMYGELCLLESALKSYGGPKRMKELAEADKDGRVVILPCAEGTTAYRIQRPVATFPDKSKPEIVQTAFTRYDLLKFGSTVFLAREEAEKALAEMEGKA